MKIAGLHGIPQYFLGISDPFHFSSTHTHCQYFRSIPLPPPPPPPTYACMHTPTPTYKHTDYTKLNLHKRAANGDVRWKNMAGLKFSLQTPSSLFSCVCFVLASEVSHETGHPGLCKKTMMQLLLLTTRGM